MTSLRWVCGKGRERRCQDVKSVHPVSTCLSPANTILVLEAQSPRESSARTTHEVAPVGARETGICEQNPILPQVVTRDRLEGWAQGLDWGVCRSGGPRVVSGNCSGLEN